MEELNQIPEENIPQEPVIVVEPTLSLTQSSIEFLSQASKWAQILAIFGFLGIGFLCIFAIIMTVAFAFLPQIPKSPDMPNMDFPFKFIGLIYIVIAAILYFPNNYLYQFSVRTKKAIQFKKDDELENSFKNLKSLFKFYVIYIVSSIALYIFMFIGFFIFALTNFRQYQ